MLDAEFRIQFGVCVIWYQSKDSASLFVRAASGIAHVILRNCLKSKLCLFWLASTCSWDRSNFVRWAFVVIYSWVTRIWLEHQITSELCAHGHGWNLDPILIGMSISGILHVSLLLNNFLVPLIAVGTTMFVRIHFVGWLLFVF